MSKETKKILALFSAIAMCATSISVSAAEWRMSGYETNDAGLGPFYQSSALIYQEFDDNGFTTGRTVSGTTAQAEGLKGFGKIEFMNPWVDIEYPNNEYAKMYVDGNYSGRVFPTGRSGKDVVEYRSANFMWEASAPYKIYNVTQARFASGWFANKSYPVAYSGENAKVVTTRPYYGFGDYKVVGDNKVQIIPSALTSWRDPAYSAINGLTISDISPKTSKPIPVEFTGSTIEIPQTFDLYLAGPTFNYNGSIASEYGMTMLASNTDPSKLNNFGISYLITTLDNTKSGVPSYCEITWTVGGYEVAPPHRTYQFLTVDGVVMDGSYIPGTYLYKPCIFRYVGNANPVITWKPDSVNANNEVLLRRIVSGVVDYNNLTGLKNSGIFVSPQYMEIIDGSSKKLDAVYRFIYDGKEYALDTAGNLLTVNWSTMTAVKSFTGTTTLSPYVPN